MNILDEVRENFRFMVSGVTSQVEQTLSFVQSPSRPSMEKIISGDDYIDTLKSLIEEKTFELLMTPQGMTKQEVALLRSVNTITSNLERLADFAANIPRQMNHLSDPSFVLRYGVEELFAEVLTGLENIVEAVEKRSAGLAFRICQSEFNLDGQHKENFAQVLNDLRVGGEPGDLVTLLFISNYLERMGDSLLNIGEAILFLVVGEKMKIHQYRALTDTLSSRGGAASLSQVEFESIWGTRSGCRIGVTQEPGVESARPMIFKHGNYQKLKDEMENTKVWDRLIPGVSPKVWEFHSDGDGKGSALIEFLPGCTLQDMALNFENDYLEKALNLLEETLGRAWSATKKSGQVSADFVGQMRSRKKAVFRIHPDFDSGQLAIGDLALPSFDHLTSLMAEIAEDLKAPFSVLIHGDLNLNNIIYNREDEKIYLIDLHRSRHTDYVQDVSVFLVSNFRLPVFESKIRSRLEFAMGSFLNFAHEFAMLTGDAAFQARLALGLARSLFSSTRFEMNPGFARNMYLRSVYLMEKLAEHRGRPWDEFRLPKSTLNY